MYREKIEELKAWKKRKGRKPLVVEGARQVGKTWLLKEFGHTCYKQCVYVNFENAEGLQQLFMGNFDVERIIGSLQLYTRTKISPSDTLIILDEIQAVKRGVTSLKYFCEDAPQYHIVVAGSLLGINIHEGESFPVGKVEFMTLRPMSFYEYLLAAGEGLLVDSLKARHMDMVDVLHDRLVDHLRHYLYIGGMPEAVDTYMKTKDFGEVRRIQRYILESYEADFSKHAPIEVLSRIRMVWKSLPAQLSKENKKFIYGVIREGARAKDFELAIEWLCDCGLVLKSHRVSAPSLPLMAYQDMSVFKLFTLDVGLLSAMVGLDENVLLNGDRVFTEFKGALTEQYVMQELRLRDSDYIGYWTNERSTAEVDFVVQDEKGIVPIEVKAETNVKARSFKFFCEKYSPERALRTSMLPYHEESWMTNIPLYAIESR